MSECPSDLRYSQSHEWVRAEEDGSITVGITDHAQNLLGDIVFVDLPETDSEHDQGDEIAVIESVKTAADVYSPLNGTVIAVNEKLQSAPAQVNQDPYGEGWLFRLKIEDDEELLALMNSQAYLDSIKED